MVRIDVTYQGGLRCEGIHGPSTTKLVTDAPVDNHGKGESFSPTDLVAAALGTCIATIMGIVAERDNIALTGLGITVEKEMSADLPRRIARLATRIVMPKGLTDQQKAKLEKAAHTCPVHQTLHGNVDMPIEFVYV
jgi:putative redox protein